jgi:hypothetical protein
MTEVHVHGALATVRAPGLEDGVNVYTGAERVR